MLIHCAFEISILARIYPFILSELDYCWALLNICYQLNLYNGTGHRKIPNHAVESSRHPYTFYMLCDPLMKALVSITTRDRKELSHRII